jgi:hypothetical protein
MATQKTVQVGYDNATIVDSERIDPSLVKATDNARPTGRLLDRSEDYGYAEEWQEPATMPDGRQCLRMYLFDKDEITDDNGEPLEAEDYPWDDDHVQRIILLD